MLNPTSDQALLGTEGERRRDRGLEGGEVVLVDLGGEAERRVDDGGVDGEEVLGDLARAGVLVAEARDEGRVVAVVVELEVDAALGEDGALEGRERRVLLHREAVLEDQARLDVVARHEREKLAGPRVDVRCVEATRIHEADCRREVLADDAGEVGAVGEVDLTAHAGYDGRVGGGVEVEFEVRRVFGGEEAESEDFGRGRLEFGDEFGGDRSVGCGSRDGRGACAGRCAAPEWDAGFGWGRRAACRPSRSLAASEWGSCDSGGS